MSTFRGCVFVQTRHVAHNSPHGEKVPAAGFRAGKVVIPIKSGENTIRLKHRIASKIIIPECFIPLVNLPVAINPAIDPFPNACMVTP